MFVRKYIDKLYSANVADLKIAENFILNDEDVDVGDVETENTLSILDRYIEEADISLDKSTVKNFMRETYQEACELI